MYGYAVMLFMQACSLSDLKKGYNTKMMSNLEYQHYFLLISFYNIYMHASSKEFH